ncbi:hypothetical protein IGI04_001477 [Brassica rapa subsp. trilocularis]|uniref:Uncharacterized protein n=1 Tax=Brassica rapa subsp. trilocularis TaxID=1813537 RepID=A0ABQ7NSR8_BRACM|nr:hypothetical protein IGI04_001477 [Brassica rapa subsp. trilocularis]
MTHPLFFHRQPNFPKNYCFRFVFSSEPLFDPASTSVISSTSVPDGNSDLNHEVLPGMETVSSISLKAHQSSSVEPSSKLFPFFSLPRSVSGICKVGNFMIWAIYRYIPLFSTRYTETNLEEQWRLPRYHFPNRSPCVAVEPLSHASPFWEDMKVKKDGELKDMICRFWMITKLLHHLNTFRQLLRERAMYGISGFDVIRSKNHFKLSVSVVAIRLYEFKVLAVANPIPFKFSKLEQVIALTNTNVQLQVHLSILQLLLSVVEYSDISCQPPLLFQTSLVDNLNELFYDRLETGVCQPRVMIATSNNPKFVGGSSMGGILIRKVEVMLIQGECTFKKALKINKIYRLETTTAHVQPALGRNTFKETLVLAEECTVHSRRHSRKSNL